MTPNYLQSDNSIDVISFDNIKHYKLFGLNIEMALATDSINIGEILTELKLIPSKTWARQNGWWYELPKGYSEVIFGKKRIRLCFLIGELT